MFTRPAFHSDRFEVVRLLGEGGMGVVYEAIDRASGERVALKTLNDLDPASLLRIKQEFRVLADVAHPNLVELGELFVDEAGCYFTMELVDGVDLVEHVRGSPSRTTRTRGDDDRSTAPLGSSSDEATIALGRVRAKRTTTSDPGATDRERRSERSGSDSWRELPFDAELTDASGGARSARTSTSPRSRRSPRGDLDESRLRATFPQLLVALDTLHRAGLVHRDVKPSNVFVDPDGRVVLLDLGIATNVDPLDREAGDTGFVVGTASFMAPEQARGSAPEPSADLYAAGVILYEALTGRLPFEGRSHEVLGRKQSSLPARPRDLAPDVPPDLDALAMDLLAIAPGERPTVAEALARLGRGEAAAARATRVGEAVFVGRSRELRRLREAFDAAIARRGSQCVLIAGEPGVGKSELVRHFLRTVTRERDDLLLLRGRCYQQESVPFKAFDGVVDALARELATMADVELDAILPRQVADLVALFPVLGRVPRLASYARDRPVSNHAETRGRAFEALRSLLVATSARRKVALVLDDVQWADVESHQLLREILAPPDPPSILVVATSRPALREELVEARDSSAARAFGAFEQLSLDGLSDDESKELVRALASSLGSPSHADLDAVLATAHGHPLLLRELVRATESGVYERGDHLRLEDVLFARVRALSEPERALMDILAVAGFRMDRDLLAEVAGRRRRDCARALRALRAERLVRLETRGAIVTVEPHHDRIREAIEAHLDTAARRSLNGRIADGMRAHGLHLHDPVAFVQKLEAAGRADEAGREAIAAADRLESSFAFESVAALLEHAIRLGAIDEASRPTAERTIADAYRRSGRARDAAAHYLAACRSTDPKVRRTSRRLAAEQLILCGDIRRGTLELDRALAEVGVSRPPRIVRILSIPFREKRLLGAKNVMPTGPSRATPEHEEQLDVRAAVYRSMNLVDPVTTAYHLYGHALMARSLGDLSRASESLIFAVLAYATMHGSKKADSIARLRAELARAAPLLTEDARSWLTACDAAIDGTMGSSAGMTDKLLEVERVWLARKERDPMRLIFVRMILLESLRASGRLGELLDYAGRMRREAERTSDLLLETFVVKAASLAFLVQDDPAAALVALDRPLWTSPDSGFHIHHLYELRARIEVDLYRDARDGLHAKHARRLRQAKLSMMALLAAFRLEIGFAEGRLLLADVGARATPERTARRVRRIARAMADPENREHRVRRHLLRAGAAAILGDSERAADELRIAIDAADRASLALEASVARIRLALVSSDATDRIDADRARASLVAEGTKRPDALVAALLPGFELYVRASSGSAVRDA